MALSIFSYVWLTHEGWAEIWWIRLSLILVGNRILPAIADQNSELGLGILPISGQTFGSSNPPQYYFHWESFWLYDLSCLLYQSSMFLEYLDLGTLRQNNWNWKKRNKFVIRIRNSSDFGAEIWPIKSATILFSLRVILIVWFVMSLIQ